MLLVISALLPVFMVIALGYFLRHRSVLDASAWQGLENLCYFVLFPVLLVKTLAVAEIGSAEIARFSGALVFAILVMTVLLLLAYPVLQRYFNVSRAAFTSLVQGATRWHGFIALSIVGLLLGDEGVAYMAVTMAIIIPLLNIINVMVLAHYGDAEGDLSGAFVKLLKNPFIIASALGAMLNISGLGLAPLLYNAADIIGSGALGIGLLTVGAGIHISGIRDHRGLVIFGALLRLLGMPALMFTGCLLFGVEGMPRTVAMLAAAVPTAASSFVLAKQMGGDAPLMANLITLQVLGAIMTLPLVIWLSQST
ncbi:MAG TPA: AEC family transporter [Gammaproteobacteria bacterium]|nr:AEC family transporter [Gammaproteobacteria bacterium]